MPTLSPAQYSLILNAISFVIATFLATGIFFFLAPNVHRRYKLASIVSGLVVTVACYHYFRIYESFEAAYMFSDGMFVASGKAFNDFYRYADWILTVPLLMVELVAVLALAKAESRALLRKLVIASLLMIGLGYPGEISADTTTRWVFWGLSMVPFLYILSVLFGQLTATIKEQPEEVRGLLNWARITVLVTWMFYPIAFGLTTVFGAKTAAGVVAIQVGYSIADVTAKAGFGMLIYAVALTKSDLLIAAQEKKAAGETESSAAAA